MRQMYTESSTRPHTARAHAPGSCRCARRAHAQHNCTRRSPTSSSRVRHASRGTRRRACRAVPAGRAGRRSQKNCQSRRGRAHVACQAAAAPPHVRPRAPPPRRGPAASPSTCSGGAGDCARSSPQESRRSPPCAARAMPRMRAAARPSWGAARGSYAQQQSAPRSRKARPRLWADLPTERHTVRQRAARVHARRLQRATASSRRGAPCGSSRAPSRDAQRGTCETRGTFSV